MSNSLLLLCKHCGLPATLENPFVKDKRKPLGVIKVHVTCSNAKKRQSPGYEKTKEKNRQKYQDNTSDYAKTRIENRRLYNLNCPERVLHSNAKLRARRNNLEFNIDFEDVVIPTICPLLEIPIYRGTNFAKTNSPSLDRIDTRQGYIKGNVRVISYKANTMKNDGDPDTLRMFIKNLEKYLDNDIV